MLFNSPALKVLLLLFFVSLAHLLCSQSRLSKNEARQVRINSEFEEAERKGLNTSGRLKFIYYFSDRERIPIMELGKGLEEDTIEVISIYQEGKKWRLSAFKNENLSRQLMEEREKALRWKMYKYKVDNFDGFDIVEADIDFSNIPNDRFLPFLLSLDNDDLYNVAMRLDKLKDHERALLAFDELIKLDFKPDTSHYKMGTALIGTHEYVEGIEHWEKAVALNPQYLDVRMDMGKLLFENSHWKKAFTSFKEADRIKPGDDEILYHLAKSLIKLERYNEAYITIKRAVKINPDNRYARGVLLNLKSPEMRKLRKKNPTM